MNGLKDVYENVGKPIDIGKWTYLVALNVSISMILGGELPGEKGAAIEGNLKENSSESMVLMGKPNVSDIFPAIARFDIQGIERGMRKINQQFNRLLESVIEVAIDKEKDKKRSEQKLGFLELLLHLEGNNNEDNASPLTMDEVKGLLVDILVGGTDTTTTMVEWTMAVLMQHPEIMEKVKKELSDVVGVNNTVEEFHLSNLSYLNAVIKETFRLHPALPLLVPRCPARSVHLNGYTIPKGSRSMKWILQVMFPKEQINEVTHTPEVAILSSCIGNEADRRHQPRLPEFAVEHTEDCRSCLPVLAMKQIKDKSYLFGITVEKIEATTANLTSLAVQ
ncbi:hypothetical protein Gotur_003957 [Gossypium turneri]